MIALVVTRGYGNGTYAGTIADVVTRGYTVGAAAFDAPISATRLYTQAGLTATTGSAAAFTATCRTERAISASTGVETP